MTDPPPPTAKGGPPRRGWVRAVWRWTLRLTAVLVVVGAVAGWFGWRWFEREILATVPATIDADTEFRIPCSVQVFAADGTRIDQFYLERRVWVPIDELPPYVWQAFVASEDRRFFEHEGVDPIGIARALVVNLRGGGTKQGGSTITQQLVKNLLVGKERSYRRKMREAVLAYRLEADRSKMQLLELYVNFVALGNGNYGVEAASQDYFGVSARELDPGQAALLAGLVPAPSRYSPRHDPELSAARREQVLRLMVEQGYVDPVVASGHLADPVVVPRASADKQTGAAFLTETRREVRRLFGSDLPFLAGLQVHTGYDHAVQEVAEAATRQALTDLEARQGSRGPVRNIPPEKRPEFLRRGDKLRVDPQTKAFVAPGPGECVLALADDPHGRLSAGPFHFALGPEDLAKKVRIAPGRPAVALASVLLAGDVLEVCVPEAGAAAPADGAEATPRAADAPPIVHLRDRPWAETAAVVIENATGNVVALVGGYEVGLEGFVRATQARRQPGSSFKPFVYANAIAHGLRQTDLVVDAPFSIRGTNGLPWRPSNYDGKFHGNIPLRTAMALSLNTVAVRLGLEYGIDDLTRLARGLGVRTPLRGDLTVALGSSEVTPLDLATAYSSLARGGVAIDPVFLTRVEDRLGTPLGTAGERVKLPGESPIRLPGGAGTRVLDPGVSYVVVDMMRNVVQNGTGKRARRNGMDFAGKTGTTSNFIDAWFVGYSPRYTVAVWVGTDGTSSLGDKETGGKCSLPAWSAIMDALPNVPGERFVVPDEAVLLPYGTEWVGYTRGNPPPAVLDVDDAPGPLPPFGGSLPP